MRFKIVLLVREEAFGNVLPVSYQFELSSCIYKKLTSDSSRYGSWLEQNGYTHHSNIKHKLFSLSNFYIPKLKVVEDRLHVLAKRVQLWISFLPEKGTEAYIQSLLVGQNLLIGDKKTQVSFTIESVEPVRSIDFVETVNYLSLSPIVVSCLRPNRSVEYISPGDPHYKEVLLAQLVDKYEHFYGHPFQGKPSCELNLLTDPKRKGIYIKRFTKDETKVIGYMYKFQLTLHPELHHLLYNTGLGDKVGLGFGCVEVLNHG